MLENEILLTVAIPTYNRREFTKRAIISVLSQATPEVEVVVCDNASTDGTCEMLEEINAEGFNFVAHSNNENIGSGRNFLDCYMRSRGKYVLLLGSDDVVIDGAIARILRFLKSHPELDLVFLNHGFFSGGYESNDSCRSYFASVFDDISDVGKSQLVDIAQEQFSFMSAWIASRAKIQSVDNPEQYVGSSFVHTCLFFQATKADGSVLGAIGSPCVAMDVTVGNSPITNTWCEIFGAKEHHVLCDIGGECGYPSEKFEKYHAQWIGRTAPAVIGGNKCRGSKWKLSMFSKYLAPSLAKHPFIFCKVAVCFVIPKPIWIMVRGVHRLSQCR